MLKPTAPHAREVDTFWQDNPSAKVKSVAARFGISYVQAYRCRLRVLGHVRKNDITTFTCPVCGEAFTPTASQKNVATRGVQGPPVCSVGCLRQRQREGADKGGIKLKCGEEHINWKGGYYTTQAREARVLIAGINRILREGV